MRTKEKYLKFTLKAFLCIFLVLFCSFFNREVVGLFAFVTVQSVKSYLPTGGSFTDGEPENEVTEAAEAESEKG